MHPPLEYHPNILSKHTPIEKASVLVDDDNQLLRAAWRTQSPSNDIASLGTILSPNARGMPTAILSERQEAHDLCVAKDTSCCNLFAKALQMIDL